MSDTRLLFFALVVTICFSACKKDASSVNGEKRLQKMVSGDGDSLFFVTFHYDASNRLTGYTSTNNTNIGYHWKTTLRYGAGGNPVASEIIRYSDQGGDSLFIETDSLVYQNNQPVKRLSHYYPNQAWWVTNMYGYNTGKIISADSTIYRADNSLWGYTSFTYDIKENIVQWEAFPKREFQRDNAITATYNTTLNVYRTLGNWVYFLGNFAGTDKTVLLSKYNVTKIDYGPLYGSIETRSYQYHYNQDGFIYKIIATTNNYGGESNWEWVFYYE